MIEPTTAIAEIALVIDINGVCSVVEVRCIGEVSGGCSATGDTGGRSPLGAIVGAVLVLGLVIRRGRRG